MSANASSEGPCAATTDPSTPETQGRAWGFVRLCWGIAAIVAGLAGVFFFFMIPALVLVVLGIPLLVSGARAFARGKPRLATGPGRYT